MTIDQFWKSTPWEIRMYVEAYNERTRDIQEIHAGMTASLMNVTQQLKRPKKFTIEKLIGRRKKDNVLHRDQFRTKEDWLKAIKQMSALMKAQERDNVW